MAAITPSTNLKLLKNPNNLSSQNQITFSNTTAQYNYFNSLTKLTVDDFIYQRKDYTIRYSACIDDIIDYNYCMYQNSAYTDKWFYAYIVNMRYLNDNATEITIQTDVFQTYQFNITYKSCFVEREHVNDDTIGAHTIPEGLETGDYISCKLQPTLTTNIETCFVVAATERIPDVSGYTTVNQLMPTGVYYYGLTTLDGVQDVIDKYQSGQGDAINSVFAAPKSFFTDWGTVTGIDGQFSNSVRFDVTETYNVTRVNYLGNDYYPKNNKLLCFPYSFLQVSNHTGQIVNYNWENFNMVPLSVPSNTISFTLKGTLTPGCSFKLFPNDYNNILNNNDDTLNLGKYPIGAFNTDVYTNWLTQNGVNICGIKLNAVQSGYAMGGIQALVGAAEVAGGNPYGVTQMATGLAGVLGTMQESYRHSLIPDTVEGNLNSGDVNFVYGLNNFEFKRMSIKNEYARCIDSYFSMFGYKVNAVKVPNITGRTNWNYVKTIDANIEGLIPEVYINEIRGLFNAGITLWHTTTHFLDYSQTNSIVT